MVPMPYRAIYRSNQWVVSDGDSIIVTSFTDENRDH